MLLKLTQPGQPVHGTQQAENSEGLLGGDPMLTALGRQQARWLGRIAFRAKLI